MSDTKKELLRSLKFVLFSISAGVIQIASFTLMEELLHLPHWLSYLVSLVLSVLWMLLQAPDLAITEAAVGAGVTGVLFFLTLKKTDQMKEKSDE